MKKKLGLIINPVAGIGGPVGLKGSDGDEIQRLARERGGVKRAGERTRRALAALAGMRDEVVIYTAPGEMGEDLARELGFETVRVAETGAETTARDTRETTRILAETPVDVLLFAGGDGTARDICAVWPEELPAVGVPAGVKIHSGVYALSPEAAGKALQACLSSPVGSRRAEVMDIDEEEYRAGRLQAKLYGYLSIPVLRGVMQSPKAASHFGADDLGGICEEMRDRVAAQPDPDTCFLLGAGSTLMAVKQALGVEGTLLGIDVVQQGRILVKDACEENLLEITRRYPCRLILTPIGGQGHIFGRGNQQFGPQVIRQVGLEHIWVVAAASKIYALPDQSLHVDTGDSELDRELAGYRKVVVGWQESLVCQVR